MSEVLAGRYRLDGTLGSGSMGVVHRAFDEVLGREVALKELVPPVGLDVSEAVDRFLTEARAAARLRHPSIVTVHDVVQHGDRVLMAMELLEGPTLHDVLQQAGRLDAASVRQVMGQIVEALAEAHSQGVVHRDLKPENVFWLPNGRVVVCDFGLARIGAGRGTQVGTVMGTPGYMAPEQVRGEEAGPAADVFALGAIAYELLAGRPAFGDPVREDQATLLYRVVNEDAAPLEVPDDPGLAQLVAWCLVKDPAQRPQQATEVLEALGGQTQVPASLPAAIPSVPPVVSSRPSRADRTLNPLVLAGGGLGLVLVVLVVVLVMVASGDGDDTVTVTTAQRFDTAADAERTESEPTGEAPEPDEPAAAETTTPEGFELARFAGSFSSIDYPSNWLVKNGGEVSQGTGREAGIDTTIQKIRDDGKYLVRMDMLFSAAASTPESAAAPVVNAIRGRDGYREIAYDPNYRFETESGTFDAVYWEFQLPDVDDPGVLLHKVDIFFMDGGRGWAVLTGVPVDEWASWEPAFEHIRSSFALE